MTRIPTVAEWFGTQRIVREYKAAWNTRGYLLALIVSAVVLCGALYVNFWAIDRATEEAGPQVQDLVLSNFRAIEVDELFVYGTFLALGFAIVVVLAHPRGIPFVVHGVTLFILIRSGFTLLTHLGPPEVKYASDFGTTITNAFFGSDQFFSGHTGMTFLAALAYWHIPWIRNTFLLSSVYFVVIVLLGHIHYSIDVASAFFITYGIYHIALWAFKREHALFVADIQA
jgi:hypothetical protein